MRKLVLTLVFSNTIIFSSTVTSLLASDYGDSQASCVAVLLDAPQEWIRRFG